MSGNDAIAIGRATNSNNIAIGHAITKTRAQHAKDRCSANDQYSRVCDIVETISEHGYGTVILPKLANPTVARLQGDGFAVKDVNVGPTLVGPAHGPYVSTTETLTQIKWD
jgi:hypothetical protein